MRVLAIVGRALQAIKLALTPLALIRLLNVFASASTPTQPTKRVLMPNNAKLAATLAAPPARDSSLLISTTGTGASGEIRPTSPIK